MCSFAPSQGIVTLLQNLTQLQDLKADPSLAPKFVEELCRYHTASAMATRRVAKVDIKLGDKVRPSIAHPLPIPDSRSQIPSSTEISILQNSFWFVDTCFQNIEAGEGIVAATQSGNRDEEVFPDPDRFDMHRKRGKEQALGYGYGQHRCVAELLARAELEVVFGMLCYDKSLAVCFTLQMKECLD